MDTTGIDRRAGTGLARTLCALVALAAGIVGVLMLVIPESTGQYFSWALAPAPLAALVGAFYVASAVVFGWAAAREGWPGLRGLCFAVFGLTVPTLMATIRHRDVFDFGRWQAVLWLGLFISSPLLFGLTLRVSRRPIRPAGPSLRPWARAILAAMAFGYAAVATLAWCWPTTVSQHGPIASGPMGIRFIGAWAAFLAILAAYAAARPSWNESRVPLLGLTAWPLAGLVAGLLHLDELRSESRLAYLAGLALLAVVAGVVLVRGRAPVTVSSPSRRARADAIATSMS